MANANARGANVGPERSILKLAWADATTEIAILAATLLGPEFTADSREWGTFAWVNQFLRGPAIHLGGGTDEIQRTILAESVLGLPR